MKTHGPAKLSLGPALVMIYADQPIRATAESTPADIAKRDAEHLAEVAASILDTTQAKPSVDIAGMFPPAKRVKVREGVTTKGRATISTTSVQRLSWHRMEEIPGRIHAVPNSNGVCFATNGILCLIRRPNKSIFIGHWEFFVKDAALRKRKTALELALEYS